ncbi:MAG: thioredoxin family protein [Gemmataceae bacterium]
MDTLLPESKVGSFDLNPSEAPASWLGALGRAFFPSRWGLGVLAVGVSALVMALTIELFGTKRLPPGTWWEQPWIGLEALGEALLSFPEGTDKSLQSVQFGISLVQTFLFFSLLLASWTVIGAYLLRAEFVSQRTTEETLEVSPARFVGVRCLSLARCIPMLFLFAALVSLPIVFLGGFSWWSGLAIFVAFMVPVVLIFAILEAMILVGIAFGFTMIPATIAAEGTDFFDGLSRTFSYLYQRPAEYLFWWVTSAICAAVPFVVFWSFWPVGRIASLFWFLSLGLSFSIFWSLQAVSYLKIRRQIDGVQERDIWDGALNEKPEQRHYHLEALTEDGWPEVVLATKVPVVIGFVTDWGNDCSAQLEALGELSRNARETVDVYHVDPDEYPPVATANFVDAVPNVLVFHKNLSPVHVFEGFASPSEIQSVLEEKCRVSFPSDSPEASERTPSRLANLKRRYSLPMSPGTSFEQSGPTSQWSDSFGGQGENLDPRESLSFHDTYSPLGATYKFGMFLSVVFWSVVVLTVTAMAARYFAPGIGPPAAARDPLLMVWKVVLHLCNLESPNRYYNLTVLCGLGLAAVIVGMFGMARTLRAAVWTIVIRVVYHINLTSATAYAYARDHPGRGFSSIFLISAGVQALLVGTCVVPLVLRGEAPWFVPVIFGIVSLVLTSIGGFSLVGGVLMTDKQTSHPGAFALLVGNVLPLFISRSIGLLPVLARWLLFGVILSLSWLLLCQGITSLGGTDFTGWMRWGLNPKILPAGDSAWIKYSGFHVASWIAGIWFAVVVAAWLGYPIASSISWAVVGYLYARQKTNDIPPTQFQLDEETQEIINQLQASQELVGEPSKWPGPDSYSIEYLAEIRDLPQEVSAKQARTFLKEATQLLKQLDPDEEYSLSYIIDSLNISDAPEEFQTIEVDGIDLEHDLQLLVLEWKRHLGE